MRRSILVHVGTAIISASSLALGQQALPAGAAPDPWNPKIKEEAETAIRQSATDPVSSLLAFKSLLDRKEDGPTLKQKTWLSNQVRTLQPQAVGILQADFDQAVKTADLRTALIASIVSERIAKGSLTTQPALTELKNKVFPGLAETPAVWSLSNVRGKFSDVPYAEGSSFNQYTLKPKPGFRFLRVTATLKNTSPTADKGYTLWAAEDIKRALAGFDPSPAPKKGPFLWADSGFIWLLTPASDLVPCSHVCEGCDLRGTMSVTISDSKDGSARVLTIPMQVESGKDIDIDVLFVVPSGMADYRLLVLGAMPVKVPIEPASGTLPNRRIL